MRTTRQFSQAVETWLRQEVAAVDDALVDSPNDLATADDVRARLAAREAHRG